MSAAGLLEPGFLFSQHSLSTYLRCPRRFLLKYVERQPWPMPDDENPRAYEAHLARGRVLHQWLVRLHLGLDMEPIVAASGDPQLVAWWQAARAFDRSALPGSVREAELPVVVPLGAYRLYARYDYLALEPGGEAMLVDWKTLEHRPSARTLATRVQTRVYLYSLVVAGEMLTAGTAIRPEQARMLYWFANYPEDSETIDYAPEAFERDGRDLLALVHEIVNRPRESFLCAQDARACRWCNYRSLCPREDVSAEGGEDSSWLDEDIDFDLDLETVHELEY